MNRDVRLLNEGEGEGVQEFKRRPRYDKVRRYFETFNAGNLETFHIQAQIFSFFSK